MAWIDYPRLPNKPVSGADVGFAFLFLLLMTYLFIGIAFASDIFMSAIETICGSKKTVKVTSEQDGVVVTDSKTIPVWNDTVANLTLMALGSSAPEILLSVIETMGGLGDQNPGELGPGTIVGSAAYNLMVITAVCITSMEGRTSRIKMYKVFGVTTMASLFAYIWMVIVLEWNTKDQVDLWEAVATFVFFPILVIMSYWADRNFCIGGEDMRRLSTDTGPDSEDGRKFYFGNDADDLYDDDGILNKTVLQAMYNQLTEIAELTPDEISSILATKLIQSKQHSRMWYRSQMTRVLMGGAKLMPVLNEKLMEVADAMTEPHEEQEKPIAAKSATQTTSLSDSIYQKKAVIEFQAATLAVSEGIGKATVVLYRTGKVDVTAKVQVESYDGTAKKGKEYGALKQTVIFEPYINLQKVEVKIFDNAVWNPDTNFYIKLTVPVEYQPNVAAGQTKIIEIIIQDDDKPGKVTFTRRGYVFNPKSKLCHLEIERTNGTDGNISAQWKTIPGPNCTLVREITGKVEFHHKELKKYIEIVFSVPGSDSTVNQSEGRDETFDVELFSPTGGAKLGKIMKTTCAISSDKSFKLEINDAITVALHMTEEAEEEISYKDQIKQSIKVNGGDTKTATKKDYILHCITFPYKVAFAFIPPPHIWGGWPTFVLALSSVGFLTKVVGETATSFGNAIGLDPVITAITFVALGTSLPDTFASRISAINDKTADNAVGNVTGSNSVNVFLGLGIPWIIGALYYKFDDRELVPQPYCVLAGSLTFNVLIYTICASISVAILTFRRYSPTCGRAELGGPGKLKWITASIMFSLWIFYIFGSSLQVILVNSYDTDISNPFKGEQGICATIIKRAKNKRLGINSTDSES